MRAIAGVACSYSPFGTASPLVDGPLFSGCRQPASLNGPDSRAQPSPGEVWLQVRCPFSRLCHR